MRGTQGSLVVLSALLLFLSSCKTLGQAPAAPSGPLGDLFELRYKAEADGKYLKDMMEKNPEMDLAEVRNKYNPVYSSYNAAITMIQRSIEMGRDPADYKADLENQVLRVRENQEMLSTYTMQKLGRSRGMVDLVKSQEAQMVLNTAYKMWQEKTRQERQNAIDALEREKMVSFEEL